MRLQFGKEVVWLRKLANHAHVRKKFIIFRQMKSRKKSQRFSLMLFSPYSYLHIVELEFHLKEIFNFIAKKKAATERNRTSSGHRVYMNNLRSLKRLVFWKLDSEREKEMVHARVYNAHSSFSAISLSILKIEVSVDRRRYLEFLSLST